MATVDQARHPHRTEDPMRRLLAILSAVALALAYFVAAPPVAAFTCGHGTVVYYDGAGATGARTALCADEYPAPNEACSFDQPYCKFSDGTSMDNRISSIDLSHAQAGTRVVLCSGYYYAGTCLYEGPCACVITIGSTLNNAASSLYSCGQDTCSDEAGSNPPH